MKNYCMYVVDSNESDFIKGLVGYDEVKNCAIHYTKSDDFESLLKSLVIGLNSGEYSDEYWYYITDETEGIILMS